MVKEAYMFANVAVYVYVCVRGSVRLCMVSVHVAVLVCVCAYICLSMCSAMRWCFPYLSHCILIRMCVFEKKIRL